MHRVQKVVVAGLLMSCIVLCGCDDLVPRDPRSLLIPRFSPIGDLWIRCRHPNHFRRPAGPDYHVQAPF